MAFYKDILCICIFCILYILLILDYVGFRYIRRRAGEY